MRHAVKLPEGPEALTPAWMTDCLRRAGALEGAEVKELKVEPFAEGVGLLGRLTKVHLRYDKVENDAPQTLVVKFPATSAQNVALCEAIRLYWREHHFYTNSADKSPLRVPKHYFSQMNGLREFVLVLEEVRDAVPGDQIGGATVEQVHLAVKQIAGHHATFWGQAHCGSESWLPSLNEPSVVQVNQALTRAGVPKLLAELPECFNAETKTVAERLADVMPALSDLLCSGPTTFVHGDFRIDNLFFGTLNGEPTLTVLDWQICYEAPGPYDVAYLMTQSVNPEHRRPIEAQVLRDYYDELMAAGVRDYSFEQCREDYRRATTFCLCYPLIAAGTLDLANERGRALGTMMLDRALSAVEDVRAIDLVESLGR